jgi:excisionase family DNA binding protein
MNELLSAAEVAEELDCTVQTVEDQARRGQLPGVKFGRSWRFPRSALMQVLHDRAMANTTVKTPSPSARALEVFDSMRSRTPPPLPKLPDLECAPRSPRRAARRTASSA